MRALDLAREGGLSQSSRAAPCDIKYEVQHGLCAKWFIALLRSSVLKTFPRPIVELLSDTVAASLRDVSEAGALW